MIIWNSSSILLRNEVQTLASRTFLEKVAESKMKKQNVEWFKRNIQRFFSFSLLLIFALSFRIFCTKCLRQNRWKTVLVTENLLYSKALRLDNLLPSSHTVMKASLSTKNNVYLFLSFFFTQNCWSPGFLETISLLNFPKRCFPNLGTYNNCKLTL